MNFRIADTFTKALSKLSAQEQSVAKITIFELQQDSSTPGLKFHRIDKSKDPNFWSIRVNRDVRIVVHKTAGSLLICYVDHHDDAYKWAERRRIEAHPKTGAAQIVEVRERVQDVVTPRYDQPDVEYLRVADVSTPFVPREPEPSVPTAPIFATLTEEQLLSVGVPEDWAEDIQSASEDEFLAWAEHLPEEAAEALFEFAATGVLAVPEPSIDIADPFDHPDARRRFRIMEGADELALAMDYPWDQWAVFLHPSQREVVDQDFGGPARVTGSAGTGKTVVALHRTARILDRNPEAKVLLTTFSSPLANALEHRLEVLTGDDPATSTRSTVLPFQGVAKELFTLITGYNPRAATPAQVQAAIEAAANEQEFSEFPIRFLMSEWQNVVDAWQIVDVEAYAEVPRLGRKNRLGKKQRERLWPVFARARELLDAKSRHTWPRIFLTVTEHFQGREDKPFSHVVVDEAQDLGVPELRMFAAISPPKPDALFFASDLGQRIFQEPFSWLALGIDVRGRSRILKVNYRTSHQIRRAVDQLLPKSLRDVDGEELDRAGTVSLFNGPNPVVRLAEGQAGEIEQVAEWLRGLLDDGLQREEIGIFVRSDNELARARGVANAVGGGILELSERFEDRSGRVSIGTMHLAKGLEFKAVVVMACDDEVLPLQFRIEAVANEAELDEVYHTERHLFYVACTRAREHLLITGVALGSEYIQDLERNAS
ncbi:MAG: UvrD-helicase domain-containing protein [Alphaproteobacteria bacterium]|nr:UvrD-helicase domain-containing protein [Alphaproteobacteria bacterium]